MRTNNYFSVLGIMLVFAACSNEENANSIGQFEPSVETTTMNLSTLDYSNLSDILSNVTIEGKTVTVKSGKDSWEIQIYKDERTKISGMDDAVLFNGRVQDSTYLTLASDYATIRLERNGEAKSFVAYKDPGKMKEVALFYQNEYSKITRTLPNEEIVSFIYDTQTRSSNPNITCVKLNTQKLLKYSDSNKISSNLDYIDTLSNYRTNESVSRVVPPEPMPVYIICLIKAGIQLLPNEISWQMQDAATALYDIDQTYISLDFKLLQSDFTPSSNDANTTLTEFIDKLRTISDFEEYHEDIFFLLQYEAWDNSVAGLAYVNVFSASNPRGNFICSGLAATSAIFPCTLAHELGHILGAEHVDDSSDLMYYKSELARSRLHKNETNRNNILNNVIWDYPEN